MTAASNANGASVTLQPCTGADAQKWTFTNGQVKTYGTSMCLDVTKGVDSDGTQLQVWSCSGSGDANQQWFYTDDNHLAWTNHGRCVDLTNGSMTAGNHVSSHFTCDFVFPLTRSFADSSKSGRAAAMPTRSGTLATTIRNFLRSLRATRRERTSAPRTLRRARHARPRGSTTLTTSASGRLRRRAALATPRVKRSPGA